VTAAEIAVVMQLLKQRVASWFDKQAYDPKAGAKSINFYLPDFAVICQN